jgi:hypothetical protein
MTDSVIHPIHAKYGTPHIWAAEIIAWALGAEIEYRIKGRDHVEPSMEPSAWVTQKTLCGMLVELVNIELNHQTR